MNRLTCLIDISCYMYIYSFELIKTKIVLELLITSNKISEEYDEKKVSDEMLCTYIKVHVK